MRSNIKQNPEILEKNYSLAAWILLLLVTLVAIIYGGYIYSEYRARNVENRITAPVQNPADNNAANGQEAPGATLQP